MSSSFRTVPLWIDRFPRRWVPEYPRHRGHLDIDVAIMGGGLTGCTIAWVFASAGVKVALFERDRLARGMGAARGLGLLRQEPDAGFQEIAALHGLRAARHVWQETRRAALDFAAALRRAGVRGDVEPQDGIWVARGRDDEKRLRRELGARREAGLTQDRASWLSAPALRRETAIAGFGAVKTPGAGQFDPYRAAIGLAAAAAAHGALIFERSAITRVRAGRKRVQIATESGTVSADKVVIASGYPSSPDYRALRRHFFLLHTYIVLTERLPAAMRRDVGRRAAMVRDADEPPHFLRWAKEDRILFAGGDQEAVPDRARARTLVQRTGQLMYELSVLYPAVSGIPAAAGWDAACARTRDGLPYFGPHRNYPRHLFALGHGRHEAGLAYLAARILLRHHAGEAERADEWFAFARTL
jgi:glycine/D-amino acid oxidase-like deaminating enzyme